MSVHFKKKLNSLAVENKYLRTIVEEALML